jgi:DNA-binding NarL/FixJ family response regulator
VRSTVAAVCRELGLAQVHQAAHVSVGLQMLQAQPFDAWLVSTAEGDPAIGLIERLRAGDFSGAPDLPVAVMAGAADLATVQRLKDLNVRRLLLQPFKIRDVVKTVELLGAGLAQPA